MINIIVASDKNGVIGSGNKLPWHLPTDLQMFKNLTKGNTVVMGRKTYESMPFYPKGLPGRNNVIISRTLKEVPGCMVVDSFETYMNYLTIVNKQEHVWIIGGGEIYRQALKYATSIYHTEVETEIEKGDTYFNIPEEELKTYTLLSKVRYTEDSIPFSVKIYARDMAIKIV